MSTVKILIEGRNFLLLIERLKKADVKLLKIDRKSPTETIIVVKYKDLKKVFAISKNLWYNTILEFGGTVGLLKKLTEKALPVLLTVLFFVFAFVSDIPVTKIEVNGVRGDKLAKTYSILKENGLRFNKINFIYDTESLRSLLFSSIDGVTFVTIKKSGNRLVINLFLNESCQNEINYSDAVFSKNSGTVLKIKTYFGTSLKKEGDFVSVGEKIADGFYIDKSGRIVNSKCYCAYYLKINVKKEYFVSDIDNFSKEGLLCKTLLDFNIDDATLSRVNIEPIIENENGVTYLVDIDYIYKEE